MQIQNEAMFILRLQVTLDDVLFLHMILFVKQQVINILCHWHNVAYLKKCAEDAHTTYSHFSVTVYFDCEHLVSGENSIFNIGHTAR